MRGGCRISDLTSDHNDAGSDDRSMVRSDRELCVPFWLLGLRLAGWGCGWRALGRCATRSGARGESRETLLVVRRVHGRLPALHHLHLVVAQPLERAHVDANNLLHRRRRRRRAPSPPRRTVVWQGRLCGLEVQQGARVQQPTQRALEVLDVARVVGQRADGVPMRRVREATSWLWTTDGGQ